MSDSPRSSSIAVGLTPLLQPVFRALWIATVISNIGTWMQDVSAAWLMTSLSPSPLMVALVQTAASLPMFLLSLPAGALADLVDRRRLLIITQSWMMGSAVCLGIFTLFDLTTPWVLLLFTAVLAIGTSLNNPAWQAITPDLVERDDVPAAVSLGGISFNLARAVGPALGGLLVAASGPGYVFLLNAASFVGVILILLRWDHKRHESVLPNERMVSAMRAGLRYARNSPALQAVLVRTFMFIIGGSALWALLPIVASRELGLSAVEYGLLMGFLGLGAVAGAIILPPLREKIPLDALVKVNIVLYTLCVLAFALVVNYSLLAIAMFAGGIAWMTVMSSFNVCAQLAVPAWVRARALAFYLVVFQAGMAIGSTLWGWLAARQGIPVAFIAASGVLFAGIGVTRRFTLREAPAAETTPSLLWPLPEALTQPHPEDGPVLISIEYRIDPERADEFLGVMHRLGVARKRDGAMRWGIFGDMSDPARYLENFIVESWAEHLRQHSRLTVADKIEVDLAHSFHTGAQPPRESHLLYAEAEG
jgi:MFS family permease